ncbi:MAG: hypothetical protein ABUL67_00505, partial [Haliangium ochraceum]
MTRTRRGMLGLVFTVGAATLAPPHARAAEGGGATDAPMSTPPSRGDSGGNGDDSIADDVDSDQAAATPGGDACIDENVKADLFAKRKRRDVRERLFQQTNRHEITVQ